MVVPVPSPRCVLAVWRAGLARVSAARVLAGALVGLAALGAAAPGRVAAAPQDPVPYTPQLNQPGKDVQWVPTPGPLVERMLDMAGVGPKDRTVDLGSGDGVLVIAAAKRGARARGIEYDPKLVEFSKRKVREAGVANRTRIDRGDVFVTDFSDATVVTTFLLPSMNFRLRPTFLAMRPGTRIVANTFGMGDWEADEMTAIEPCERWCTAMLWIVPGRVGGTWRTPHGDLVVTQRFQMVSGTLGGDEAHGRLRGEDLSLSVGSTTYEGRVNGTRLRIRRMPDGPFEEWTAVLSRQ